ncbi:MAG: helix-turn-helix domain-containing protein [Actinomycetota bacterium]|nr:helix-turn-helix domain-containing protein [Actinomycetota bacterium]
MTTRQAAEIIGVTRQNVNHLIRTGSLRACKDGNRWLVSADDADVFGPWQPPDRRRGRTLRLRFVAALVALAIVAPAAPAFGWANGSGGCDRFGTHDWVLKKAVKAAGPDANWVRLRVALRATDDPDCKDGIDHASGTWWHVYDRWGDSYGGADEATAVWFRRTKHRLEAGREPGARDHEPLHRRWRQPDAHRSVAQGRGHPQPLRGRRG